MKPPFLLGAAALLLASSASIATAQPSTSADREAAAARKVAGASLFTMSRNAERTSQRLRDARARRDRRAASCLDAALSRVDVTLRSARDDAKRADAAWRAGDVGGARIAMSRIASSLAASTEAARAGEACVARPTQPSDAVEGTTLEVEVPPGLPTDATNFPR